MLDRAAGACESGPPLHRLLIPALALLLAAVAGSVALECRMGVLEPDRIVAIDNFLEISGIVWWPEHGTLVGVPAAPRLGAAGPRTAATHSIFGASRCWAG